MTTRRGGWNAPAMFFPHGRSHAVFPPYEASTIERSVVGTLIHSIPRIHVAAANPVRSPVTPPPTAVTTSLRPRPAFAKADHISVTVAIVLCSSPDGTTYIAFAAISG